MVLNENNDLMLKNEEIAKTLNDYFDAIVDNLDLHHWEGKTSPSNTSDKINVIIKNYEKHPRICSVKKDNIEVLVISHFDQFLLKKSKSSFENLILTTLLVLKYQLSY